MKVLMVDDSASDRKLCRFLLEETQGPSLEFVEARNAMEGLRLCKANGAGKGPDCILLDYRLPDMTGLEFVQALGAQAVSLEAPVFAVVMLTGLASEQVAVEAMKAGAQDYLVKDRITAEGLSTAIERAIQKVGLLQALKTERDHLAQALSEKDVLLHEVHHRVKNNLQVIASLLKMQADAMGNETLSLALRQSQNRVESMALIHEQLYQTDDFHEVDLAKQAGLLTTSLVQCYEMDPGRVTWRVDLQPLRLAVDRAIPAGLILNELISNALKHAFPGGRRGTLSIEGGRQNGFITIDVRDDGVGIPAGLDPKNLKSLGLQIVSILARQLKGSLEIERLPVGTRCRILFPEA